MSGEKFPAKRWFGALVGAVAVLSLSVVPVSAAEWPLKIVAPLTDDLPPGRGMPFFEGVWEQTSARMGGGDMTITDKAIEFRQATPPSYEPYKVLHTARNYVLIALKRFFPSGNHWTSFLVLTVRNPQDDNGYRNLVTYMCTEPSMESAEPFDWPAAKLLEAFKKSRCLAKVDEKNQALSLGDFWSSARYQWAGPEK